MYKLPYILKNVRAFKWSDALYLPEDEVWTSNTLGMVLDPDDVDEDDDDIPKKAKDNKLIYALSIQIIQTIVQDALQQKEDLSEEELVDAYLYYYDNDAYIKF